MFDLMRFQRIRKRRSSISIKLVNILLKGGQKINQHSVLKRPATRKIIQLFANELFCQLREFLAER